MKLSFISPQNALDKHFVKLRPLRNEIELFKQNLINLLDNIDEIEREENQKNHVRDFLRESFYKGTNEINTKGAIDLVIHQGKTNRDTVGVILETKRPSNKAEMLTADNPNAKALHELVLYYMNERTEGEKKNTDIKYLVATNIYEWYIFEGADFERLFYQNKNFKKDYLDWKEGRKTLSDTSFFYNEIAKPYIDTLTNDVKCIYFDIRYYEKIVRNKNYEDDKKLVGLYKVLSPYFLLKTSFINDSNSLNDKFYKELLHIIGLEEIKEGGLNIIRRKEKERQNGSLLENAITILETEDVMYRIKDRSAYGDTKEEQFFGVALSLCLTWVNRILFLKLLEGQLITYHKNDKEYLFLNTKTIPDFDELYKLFHQVLARNVNERSTAVAQKYAKVPYLNSSLFDFSELEAETIKINQLDDWSTIELMGNSVLKDIDKNTPLKTLDYLFRFLDAYDFASEGGDEIAENNKTIINASVLGKVFEKINGYKDGSIFTPGVITMYMSREVIRKAVLQKFNEYFKSNEQSEVSSFDELYNKLDKISIDKANEIINSLRICDPSVGSGHFLVSVLNELIVIKYELGILADNDGKRLSKRDYEIIVENDELIIFDENRNLFKYSITNKESQRVQETIFRERHDIIENCLFGVDINENSVKICRLRLWIELLKSSYYKAPDFVELETLPNIDINIKHGNSLLSRYPLDADLKKALQQNKIDILSYRKAISDYRNATSKEQKREMEQIIFAVKNNFETEIQKTDKRFLKLSTTKGELYALTNQVQMFETSKKEQEERDKKLSKLTKDLEAQENEIKQIQDNSVYKNAFEWRFEFPEVLNEDGDFVGFDVIIGNPPYVQLQANGGGLANQLENQQYETFARTGDIYCLFYEKGHQLLRPNGFLNFITSNKWMRAGYGEATRKFLAEKTNPISLIDFSGQKVFDNATVDVNILLFSKQKNEGKTTACIVKEKTADKLSDYIRQNSSEIDFNSSGSDSWVVLSSIEQRIKAKIEKVGTPLKDWDINIYRGILTGYNEAFIIDGNKKDELIAKDPKSAEVIRPILRGRDIKRYGYDFADLYLIAIFPSLKIDIEEYPEVKEHLLSFGYDRLKQTGENGARKKTNNKWFETQDTINYWEDFSKQKIMWKRVGSLIRFCYDDKNCLALDSTCFATGKYIRFLIVLLNSKMGNYLLQDSPKTGTGDLLISVQAIEPIKVPLISIEQEKLFNSLFEEILSKKNYSEVLKIERMIDNLIFDLYDLTIEERDIIEFK